MIKSHIHWIQEDIPKALIEINEAIRKNPRDPRFYHFRAYLTSIQGHNRNPQSETYAQEMADYDFVMTLPYKRMPIIWSNYGNIYCALENFTKAEECFNKAIALRPILTDARNNKAVLYYSIREFTKAIDELNQLLEINPHIAAAYSFKARCYFALGSYMEALKYYKIALQKDNKQFWDLNMCSHLSVKCGIPLQEIIDTILSPNISNYIDIAVNLLNLYYQHQAIETNNENTQNIIDDSADNNVNNTKVSLNVVSVTKSNNNNNGKSNHVAEAEAKNITTILLKLGELCAEAPTDQKEKVDSKPRIGSYFIKQRLDVVWRLLCFALRTRSVLFYLTRNSKQGFEDLKRLGTLTKSFTQFPFLEHLLTSVDYESISPPVVDLVDKLMKMPFFNAFNIRMYVLALQDLRDKVLKTANERRFFLCCYEWKAHFGDQPIELILAFLRTVEETPKFKKRCQSPYYLLHYWRRYRENGDELPNNDDEDDEDNDNDEEGN
jgi:tetratricopeptide (TPR) repeat protein